jgi:hypothetical protein
MGVRKLALVWLMVVCGVLGGLVFGCGGAFGAVRHEFLSSIREVPGGAALPGQLGRVSGLAVDGGVLYVADDNGSQASSRLDRFGVSSGEFLTQFPQEPGLAYLHDGVAVGHATGEAQVYTAGDVAGSQEGAVGVFAVSGAALAGSPWRGADTPSGGFGCFECGSDEGAVAVDGSGIVGDWASGDVYVVDRNNGVVDVFKPKAGGGEEYLTRLEGSEPGVPFGEPTSVAVDQTSGDVLVGDRSVVYVFEPVAGMPLVYSLMFTIAGTPAGAFGRVQGVAADGGNGEIYVAAGEQEGGKQVVDQFSTAGVYLGQLTGTPAGAFGHTRSVTVDPETHRVFVGDYQEGTGGVVDVFGEDLTIPDVLTGVASGVSAGVATLNGTVNPDGIPLSECGFEYGTSTGYGQRVPCAQSVGAIGSGTSPVAVSASVAGLTPGTVYHFRLVAGNGNGESQGFDHVFGPPLLDGESSSGEAQTAATVEASVNPEGLDTTYRFEYGTSSAYGTSVPVPDGDIGAGEGDVPLSAALTGLQAGVTYHYRVVAVNAAGTSSGEDETFVTVPPARIEQFSVTNVTRSGATVRAVIDPLGRDTTYRVEYGTTTAYGTSVPVPAADIGAGTGGVAVAQQLTGLEASTTYHVRVAASNALGTAYSADHTFIYDTSGGGLPDGRAYELVTPPHKNGALIGNAGFRLPLTVAEDGLRVVSTSIQCFAASVSCNALSGGVSAVGSVYEFSRAGGGWVTTPLSPPASEFSAIAPWQVSPDTGMALFSMPTPPGNQFDFYVREPDGSLVHVGPYTPPSKGEIAPTGDGGYPSYVTNDLSHIVWQAYEDERWPFDATTGDAPSVYEYSGVGASQPALVGVSGGPGSTDLISVCGTVMVSNQAQGADALWSVSGDGSVVFFQALACSSGSGANAGVPVPVDTLYARIDGSRTVLISGRSAGDCTGACQSSTPSRAEFWGASKDGSRAFFTSLQRLTDTASEGSGNLYEYDFANPAGHSLVDLSAGDTSGGGPRVQTVQAVSPDGSHVYFVAQGVLAGAANALGQRARAGAANLYVFERDATYPAGHVAFIASLQSSAVRADLRANVTPDGRFLVFTSRGDLTPDDTSVSGALQVFRYDAQTGQLVRISIGNNGFDDNGNRSSATPCGVDTCIEDASIVSAAAGVESNNRSDPTMSHDGSYVFFMSPVALTSGALDDLRIGTNGSGEVVYAQNVYEWHEGHVYLISDGRDINFFSHGAKLMGSDATGANVFFFTADRLAAQDIDTELDVYDARICTAGEPCVEPAVAPAGCAGEACHGSPAGAPLLAGAGTVSVSGSGNRAPAAKNATVKKAKGKPKRRHRAKPKKRKRHASKRHARKAAGRAGRSNTGGGK